MDLGIPDRWCRRIPPFHRWIRQDGLNVFLILGGIYSNLEDYKTCDFWKGSCERCVLTSDVGGPEPHDMDARRVMLEANGRRYHLTSPCSRKVWAC